ncbi:MAG: PAS domain S-box protein [Rhodothermales bacterium]
MIVFVRPDLTVGLINEKGREILGFNEEEIVGRAWIDTFVPKRLRRQIRSICGGILEGRDDEYEYGENMIVTASGEERLIRWHSALVRDECGDILGILASGEDITDRRKGEQALRESEARFRAILETTVDAVITADESGRIETFNPAAERIFGYEAEEVIGQNLSILMPPPYKGAHNSFMASYLETEKRKVIGIGRETIAQRKDGSVFPIDLAVSEARNGGRRFFTGVIRDISDRRRLEQEVLRISEAERQRIGRDLHDGLGSLLSGLALGAQGLAESVRRGGSLSVDDLEMLAEMIEQGASQAQALSRGLNPVKLEQEGLAAALEEMAANVKKLTGITCTFSARDEVPHVDGSVATQLYRIAQEAVNNAVKHAHADRISVELDMTNDRINLMVRDNGVGLPDNPDSSGMGIHIMPYRARLIDGQFDIRRGDLRGTDVSCSVRLDRLK